METIINRNTSFRSHQPIIKDHRKFVWQSLRNNPDGLTAQDITDLSNNKVSLISSRSRLNELLNDCLIRIKGSARNPKTGKVNTTYCLVSKVETKMMIENKLINVNKDLVSYKRISTIIFVKDDWNPENEILTPTMKIKRNKINDKYCEKFKGWSDNIETVIWE